MGFGKRRSIVLYDNLVRSLSDDEILAVIVHEVWDLVCFCSFVCFVVVVFVFVLL